MKPILVTGANRSGTTWVGRMLSFTPELFYVWEPFNPEYPLPLIGHPLNAHYRRLLPDEYAGMRRFIRLKAVEGLVASATGGHSILAKFRKLSEITRTSIGCFSGKIAPLYKDPIALMSAEWMAIETGARVVITVRHPAAYVNSIRRLGWKTGLKGFVNEPLVLDSLPAELRSQVTAAAEKGSDTDEYVLQEAAIWWNIFYWTVNDYRARHPDWIIVRHEDLSGNYMEEFRELCRKLGLTWTEDVSRRIEEACSSKNVVVQGDVAHSDRQDSAALVKLWQKGLSREDKTVIRKLTEPVSSLFYDDASWD